ncbi:hypothetical protein [Lysinibacillus xylanilyticus]|uniref:hypothetical protein n=1 Tax=Lysinibacillus xylanilyticus TaxID=582475 RepID=UPI0037FC06EA
MEEKEFSIEEEFQAVFQEEIETNNLIYLTQCKINEYDKYKEVILTSLSEIL